MVYTASNRSYSKRAKPKQNGQYKKSFTKTTTGKLYIQYPGQGCLPLSGQLHISISGQNYISIPGSSSVRKLTIQVTLRSYKNGDSLIADFIYSLPTTHPEFRNSKI